MILKYTPIYNRNVLISVGIRTNVFELLPFVSPHGERSTTKIGGTLFIVT